MWWWKKKGEKKKKNWKSKNNFSKRESEGRERGMRGTWRGKAASLKGILINEIFSAQIYGCDSLDVYSQTIEIDYWMEFFCVFFPFFSASCWASREFSCSWGWRIWIIVKWNQCKFNFFSTFLSTWLPPGFLLLLLWLRVHLHLSLKLFWWFFIFLLLFFCVLYFTLLYFHFVYRIE